jgi:arabinose-5-phosphate isomerase
MRQDERDPLLEKARDVFRIEAEAVKSLEERFGDEFIAAIDILYGCKGRVIVSGIGKSGIVAKKIASTFASTGTPALFLHPVEGIHGDLGMVVRGDVVLIISKSGEMDQLPQLLSLFKRLEVKIIAITASTSATLAASSEVVLDMSVKEEACPYGLAPTASTTVALAIGDALAIALLLKRGFKKEDFAIIHPGGTIGKKLLFKVKDLMLSREDEIPRISISSTMKEAIFEMAAKRGITSVVDADGKVVGVVTNGDLMRLADKTEHIFHIPVTEVMAKTPKVIQPDELAITAVKMMEQYGIISMPVVDEQRVLIGVIHLHDMMRAGII